MEKASAFPESILMGKVAAAQCRLSPPAFPKATGPASLPFRSFRYRPKPAGPDRSNRSRNRPFVMQKSKFAPWTKAIEAGSRAVPDYDLFVTWLGAGAI
jgi:hypothetical protein